MAHPGCFAALVELLSEGGADGVKVAAARAVSNIARRSDANGVAIVQAGAFCHLVAMRSVCTTDAVRKAAVRALRRLKFAEDAELFEGTSEPVLLCMQGTVDVNEIADSETNLPLTRIGENRDA